MSPEPLRGYWDGSDGNGHDYHIPRYVDPMIDGTTLVAQYPVLFDVDEPPDSIPLQEFDELVESVVPADVLGRIDHVMAAGVLLHGKGLADAPPLVAAEWRRAMVLSWSHARDLGTVLVALGHGRDVAGHDTDEIVPGCRLQERLEPSAAQWYRDYVSSLDSGALVNVGFFNPHISASLFRWGDVKSGVQNAMDAHRLVAHHQGTPEHPVDWIERATNFVVHHIPREHWGIRHEPRGSWDDLERRLEEDPAIRSSTIGQTIARDAALMYAQLEREGKVVPWQLLLVPAWHSASEVEHARLLLAVHAERMATSYEALTDSEDELDVPTRVERARDLVAGLPSEIDELVSGEGSQSGRSAERLELARRYQSYLNVSTSTLLAGPSSPTPGRQP